MVVDTARVAHLPPASRVGLDVDLEVALAFLPATIVGALDAGGTNVTAASSVMTLGKYMRREEGGRTVS